VQDAVKMIDAVKPDAVVMISAYTSIAEFVREMRAAGSAAQLHNASFVGSKARSDALGNVSYGVAISKLVPYPWGPAVPIVKEYQQVMKQTGNGEYNFSSLEGFIVGKVTVEALKRAGKDLTREKLIAALESMSNTDLGGFVVDFSPTNHSGSKFVD